MEQGFNLGRVYRVHSLICLFDEKFLLCCPLILIKFPDTPKCAPQKQNRKDLSCMPYKNVFHAFKIMLYVKYCNPFKLDLRAMAFFFYMKIKNESHHLIGMVTVIDPVCCSLPETLGTVSKYYEIIIFIAI